jgi:hypothetical protein
LTYLLVAGAALLPVCYFLRLPLWATLLPLGGLVFWWIKVRAGRGWQLLGALLALVGWAVSRQVKTPTHDREWRPEIARLPSVEVDGERVTVSNVRNFSWNEDDSFVERWETRSYDLRELTSLDLWVEPLAQSNLLAHNMVSFGFGDEYLTLSIEARKEVGESFGMIPGSLNELELIYLFVSENDTLTRRAVVDGARLYRCPVAAEPDFLRTLFLDFAGSTNKLLEEPKFYALIRQNCTTTLAQHADRQLNRKIGMQWDILFPARSPRVLERRGILAAPPRAPGDFENFRADSIVREHPNSPELSRFLREKP